MSAAHRGRRRGARLLQGCCPGDLTGAACPAAVPAVLPGPEDPGGLGSQRPHTVRPTGPPREGARGRGGGGPVLPRRFGFWEGAPLPGKQLPGLRVGRAAPRLRRGPARLGRPLSSPFGCPWAGACPPPCPRPSHLPSPAPATSLSEPQTFSRASRPRRASFPPYLASRHVRCWALSEMHR